MKRCKKCKLLKPLKDFDKHTNMKDNHISICKECKKENNRKYQQKYWEKNKEKLSIKKKEYFQSPTGIWSILRENRSKRKISKEDFVKWYDNQLRRCAYCNIEEKEIIGTIFKKRKVSRLQIDRKNPNKSYQKNNIVLACPQCNWMKGSYFNFNQMKLIGQVLKKIRKNKIK